MNAAQTETTVSRASLRRLAKSLAQGDPDEVVTQVMQMVDELRPNSRLAGPKKLLVEAGVALVFADATENVVPTPFRLFAAFDLQGLMDYAYGTQSDDDVRQKVLGYLRRIGIASPEGLASNANIEDQHLLICIGVTAPFEATI